MLPDLDGLEVTRRLRADGSGVPVLFLTARDTLQDKPGGSTIGGDDTGQTVHAGRAVAPGPCHPAPHRAMSPTTTGCAVRRAVELDENAREVAAAGNEIQLTATEFNLLRYFLLDPRQVLSK